MSKCSGYIDRLRFLLDLIEPFDDDPDAPANINKEVYDECRHIAFDRGRPGYSGSRENFRTDTLIALLEEACRKNGLIK